MVICSSETCVLHESDETTTPLLFMSPTAGKLDTLFKYCRIHTNCNLLWSPIKEECTRTATLQRPDAAQKGLFGVWIRSYFKAKSPSEGAVSLLGAGSLLVRNETERERVRDACRQMMCCWINLQQIVSSSSHCPTCTLHADPVVFSLQPPFRAALGGSFRRLAYSTCLRGYNISF